MRTFAANVRFRDLQTNPARMASQVNQWSVVMTIAIVVGLLVLYFDALTGYWLGAVLGRLVLVGIAVVVMAALLLGKNGPESRR